MNRKVFTLLLLISSMLLSSCEFKEPELISVNEMKVSSFSKDGIVLTIRAKVRNPNNYRISLVNTDLDVLINGTNIGKAELVEKVHIKGNSTEEYLVELKNVPENFAQLGVSTLFSVLGGGGLNINVKGSVKGRARLVSKKFDVDVSRKLKLPGLSK